MIDISTVPVREFVEANTTRLISTAYIDEPALAPLVDDDNELTFLEELEGLSSSRRGLPEFIPAGVQPDELVNAHHGYGWTYINAAFCYTRETGNRFNGPARGAWYATWDDNRIDTAHAEVAWHLTQELHATGIYENITSFCELTASFATIFHDLTGCAGEDVFHPEPDIGYSKGQGLAAELFSRGANGVLYPSVRQAGGHCLAAFRPNIIQNVRQGEIWTFTWAGDPKPLIEKASSRQGG
ncbi:MAG: RES family NAD+ phosphorylase [Alphaproteobacteria bacterium]|nr:RES family NAD+ phosphorylase [Alphaproteobacteria bacterium]